MYLTIHSLHVDWVLYAQHVVGAGLIEENGSMFLNIINLTIILETSAHQ